MANITGTVPISTVVKINPGTIGVAGGVSFINGLLLSNNPTASLPAGTLKSYTAASEVATDFTVSSPEAKMAAVYFAGYENATKTPSTMLLYVVDTTHEADPATLLNTITGMTQDFSGFTTTWEPTLSEKQAFASWVGGQSDRYWYVPWDTDDAALVATNSTSFGTWLKEQNIDGTTPVYKDPLAAMLALGWMASLDFSATNGRTNLCFRSSGLVEPSVGDAISATTLTENGYSFYAGYANGLGRFQWFAPGNISGQFLWADSYINQIWLNASFQSDLVNLLRSIGQIPYNTQGDAYISASVQDTINQALSFGVIRAGVNLTSLQKQQIDQSAGVSVSSTVQTHGWYFQPNASSASADIRAERKSPPCKFWYTDGQSVQQINLSSVEVQ